MTISSVFLIANHPVWRDGLSPAFCPAAPVQFGPVGYRCSCAPAPCEKPPDWRLFPPSFQADHVRNATKHALGGPIQWGVQFDAVLL